MPRNARASDRASRNQLLAELAAIYADVDAAYAGSSCPASTECCHFDVTGREPYVTSIELALVAQAIAAKGGVAALRGGRKPGAHAGTSPSLPILPILAEPALATGRCPLLDASGRCSIYAARPLGCRTFYCERASLPSPVRQREVNAFVRRIQELAVKHEPSGDRGRPLTRALRDQGLSPSPRR